MIKSVAELLKKMQEHRTEQYQFRVCVCGGTGCSSNNSQIVYERFLLEIKKAGLEEVTEVIQTGCHGMCSQGPIVTVYPGEVIYSKVTPDDVEIIVEDHLLKGEIVRNHEYPEFQQDQKKVALRNCGKICPDRIEDAIGVGGYQALAKVLTEMEPENVIDILIDSGLRGRGGAGFLTGRKWQMAAQQDSDVKYVFCNADEGDLGAYMDRSIMEADPHTVLEAMEIAGYAVGAVQGYIYTRPEYTVAVKRLQKAINQAREEGLLGENILGTGFNFDVELRLSAGAYVCGEETAMMNSFVQSRGEPRQKNIYPAQQGLYKKPTIINNVETLATIPPILQNGAAWFRELGKGNECGTKVFALDGALKRTGLVEVPMGTSLYDVLNKWGGGMLPGCKLKAVQTGGAAGGYIPETHLDVKLGYDELSELGTLMGAGGLSVLDDKVCIVDHVKYQVEFSVRESCGKCTACRIGTKRMYELLDKITKGVAEIGDLDRLEQLARYIKENSLCGLGQEAPNPVLSSLTYFRDEYLAHITEKKCPAGGCRDLVRYHVKQEKCEGCGVCAASCPIGCISELSDETKIINPDACTACGTCMKLCPADAIYWE